MTNTTNPVIDEDGNKEWFVNRKLHRTDGPAVVEFNGTKVWHVNGKLHRTDGPAVEYTDGTKEWYVDEKLHRVDGPAVERANGTKQYWLFGNEYEDKFVFEAAAAILVILFPEMRTK